jgi:hypothetical protein
MRRFTFIVGVAIGYVLGTRAGRERYEQLRKLARKAAESPAAQQAMAALQAQAVEAAKAAGGRLADRAGTARAKFGEALHEHMPGMRDRDTNGDSAGHGHNGYAPARGSHGGPDRN